MIRRIGRLGVTADLLLVREDDAEQRGVDRDATVVLEETEDSEICS
jgi:hypothetical protein